MGAIDELVAGKKAPAGSGSSAIDSLLTSKRPVAAVPVASGTVAPKKSLTSKVKDFFSPASKNPKLPSAFYEDAPKETASALPETPSIRKAYEAYTGQVEKKSMSLFGGAVQGGAAMPRAIQQLGDRFAGDPLARSLSGERLKKDLTEGDFQFKALQKRLAENRAVGKDSSRLIEGAKKYAGIDTSIYPQSTDTVNITNRIQEGGKRAADIVKESTGITPENATFTDKLAEGFGSSLPYFVPGVGMAVIASRAGAAAKWAMLFGNVMSSTLEASAEASQVYDEVKKTKGEQAASEAFSRTFLANAILLGLTERLGIFNPNITGAIKRGLISMPTEGFQEAVQQLIQNNESGRPIMEGVLESGAIGAIVGGVLGAGVGIATDTSAPGGPPGGPPGASSALDTNALIRQTQTNMVDGLRAEGNTRAADNVSILDASKFSSVEQFSRAAEAGVKVAAVPNIPVQLGPKPEPLGKTPEKEKKSAVDELVSVPPSPSPAIAKGLTFEEWAKGQKNSIYRDENINESLKNTEASFQSENTQREFVRANKDWNTRALRGETSDNIYTKIKQSYGTAVAEYVNDGVKYQISQLRAKYQAAKGKATQMGRRLTLKPENLTAKIAQEKEKIIKENEGFSAGMPNIAESQARQKVKTIVEIGGKEVPRPRQLINKSDIKGLVKMGPITFTVAEKDGKKVMTFEHKGTKMTLHPSALGLVEENFNTGDTLTIDKNNLKEEGTSFRVSDEQGNVVASLKEDLMTDEVDVAKTVDDFKHRIDQLNKFGQKYAILRRTGGLSNKAAGIFRMGKRPKGQVHLQDSVALNPKQYMSTLAHELGHALEYTLTGGINKNTFDVFGKELSKETKAIIRAELKALTNDMVGEATAKAVAGYYYQNTELLARFLQAMFISPGKLSELAPTALEHFEKNAVEVPILQEYLEAVYGRIDKGHIRPFFFRDMKETYQKYLGKRIGEMAWNDEKRYRSMKERAKILVEKMINSKFKDVKDSPETLFRAAESIKVTKNGVPEFGTRDFQYSKNDKETAKLLENGYEMVKDEGGKPVFQIENGEQVLRFAKSRYTAEEGQRIFGQLSPEGQQLVKDFTAFKDDAKDYFNREVIKDVHKINSELEGWVHHYWEEDSLGMGGPDKLRIKVAAAKKQRKGAEGYVEDLQKAMTKALTELETTKAYNAFIDDYFARVSKPIAKGTEPEKGWVEVQGDVKKGGIGTPEQTRMRIIQDDKSFPVNRVRYQMPTVIYKRFQMIRELAVEAGTAVRIVNSLNRYWIVNILFHLGSASTNFESGGIQYSSKVLTDFYTEILTGSVTMPKTRSNIFSMITVLTPTGWQNSPDWVYGGDMSNFYGQFGTDKTPGIKALDTNIDKYADKVLKIYGLVERYWKKVILLSEGSSSLQSLDLMTAEGLRLPTEEEKTLMDEINKEVDLFAYDYDNVPMAIEQYQQNWVAQGIKPFIKYPYKYSKHVTELIHAAFDRTLPWQERMAKILALTTVMAIYSAIREDRKKKRKTEEVNENAPAQVSTRGRVYIRTDAEGKEIFTRTSKYPFINITEAGWQLAEGNFETARQQMTDMIGGVAPGGKVALAMFGYKSEYGLYTPIQVSLGEDLASFVPGSRILEDISRFFDPYQGKKTTFLQGFTSKIPTTSEALQ